MARHLMQTPTFFTGSRAVCGLIAQRWKRRALVLLAAVAPGLASAAGDAARGAAVFSAECSGCHSVEAGKNIVGPSLHSLIGRTAGSIAGFDYSSAMRGSGIVWDEARLDGYLSNPAGTVPGIRMPYPGLHNPGRRADLIAYLASQH